MENAETAPGAVKKVVIAGGGTAGWVAAMTLSKQFGKLLDISLVESEEIGTIGVGESTVPPIVAFHQLLGIDERDFMRECAATFKVGIWFEHWGRIGDQYCHPFGRYGQPTWMAEFYNFWLHARTQGSKVPLAEYCYEYLAALKGKFALRENPRINYAYHFDAALYARYLRKLCRTQGREAHRRQDQVGQTRMPPPVLSNRSSSTKARWSRATSSSTALAFVGCSSKAPCKPVTKTGRTGCRAIARWRFRPSSMNLRHPIRPVMRTPLAGAGTSPFSIAWAMASCSAASTCLMTRLVIGW